MQNTELLANPQVASLLKRYDAQRVELDRQHAINAELLVVLRWIAEESASSSLTSVQSCRMDIARINAKARAALTKAGAS